MVSKDLIEKLSQGNKKAFNEIFQLFHQKIFIFCLKYHFSKEESEEVVQEVFLKLWLNRKSLNPSQNLKSYIYTIAKNIIINSLRKKSYQKAAYEYNINLQDIHCETENSIITKDLENLFENAIQVLPGKRKEIFILSRKEGLSNKEIAEKLNISIKTVESQMRLSFQFLKEVLKKYANVVIVFIQSMLLLN